MGSDDPYLHVERPGPRVLRNPIWPTAESRPNESLELPANNKFVAGVERKDQSVASRSDEAPNSAPIDRETTVNAHQPEGRERVDDIDESA